MRDWPTARSQISIISCPSPSPSAIIFPVSSVTSCPRSCLNSRKALPRRRTVSPRTGPGVVRHFEKASCAREIALSYSSAEAVRTLASLCPLIGEILSIFAPPPRHSPSKTPALSSAKPSFCKTDCIKISGKLQLPKQQNASWKLALPSFAAAILPQQIHRFVHYVLRDVERRTKTNGTLA